MKLSISVFALGLLLCLNANAQTWDWQNPRLGGHSFSDICFADSQNVWAVGGPAGASLKSTDGGQTWQEQVITTSCIFQDIVFVNSRTGWVVGSDTAAIPDRNLIYHTTDNGVSWTEQYNDTGRIPLTMLNMVDTAFGMAATNSGVQLRTTNGGQTWAHDTSNFRQYGIRRSLVDRQCCFAYDADSLYKTTDGGATWWSRYLPAPEPVRRSPMDIWMTSRLHGSLIMWNTIYTTTDGGVTWAYAYPQGSDAYPLYRIHYTDSLNGWVSDHIESGCLLRTTDGGVSWFDDLPIPFNSAVSWGAFDVLPGGRAVACGWSGTTMVYRTNADSSWQTAWGDPAVAFTQMVWLDDQQGWTLGREFWGQQNFQPLRHTTDGGNTWTPLCTFTYPDSMVTQIAFPSATQGWAIGHPLSDSTTANFLLHSTDGGASWAFVDTVSEPWLAGISFPNPDSGYVTTHGNAIWRTFDGGANWTRLVPGVHYSFEQPYFVDGLTGWIPSVIQLAQAVIVRTTDGGNSWVSLIPGDFLHVRDVHFFDRNHGWALMFRYEDPPQTTTLVTTRDGGIHWQTAAGAGGFLVTHPAFLDSLNGFALAMNDATIVIRTNDGGQSWTFDSHPVSYQHLLRIYVNPSRQSWLVGESGAILHRISTLTPNSASPRVPVPQSLTLTASPNPFNPGTLIEYSVPSTGRVKLEVFDLTGRHVMTLVDHTVAAGSYRNYFDGSGLPSGIYFARLQANGFGKTQKLVLLK